MTGGGETLGVWIYFFSYLCVFLVFPIRAFFSFFSAGGNGRSRLPVVEPHLRYSENSAKTTRLQRSTGSAAKTITGQKSYEPHDEDTVPSGTHTHSIVFTFCNISYVRVCYTYMWTIRVEIDFGCPRTGRPRPSESHFHTSSGFPSPCHPSSSSLPPHDATRPGARGSQADGSPRRRRQ